METINERYTGKLRFRQADPMSDQILQQEVEITTVTHFTHGYTSISKKEWRDVPCE